MAQDSIYLQKTLLKSMINDIETCDSNKVLLVAKENVIAIQGTVITKQKFKLKSQEVDIFEQSKRIDDLLIENFKDNQLYKKEKKKSVLLKIGSVILAGLLIAKW